MAKEIYHGDLLAGYGQRSYKTPDQAWR